MSDPAFDRPSYSARGPLTGRSGLLLALLLAAPALWPLLRPGFFSSDDGLFHVYRTAALADAWRHGVLWPRLFPEFGFGYGQAVLNFYAPLTYVPGALLAVLAVHPATAVQVVIALSTLLAAAAAYAYGRSLFGAVGGVLAAVVYTYAPYHLADAYLRGALPEHAAFVFPPLILWAQTAALRSPPAGAQSSVIGDRLSATGNRPSVAVDRVPLAPLLWSSLAWAGLALTHNLTALLFAPVGVLHLLALAGWTGHWRRLPATLGAIALAAGLSAVFWLPALVESGSVGLSLGPSEGYANHLLTADDWLRRSPFYFVNPPDDLGRVYPLSWLAVALVGLTAILLAARAARRGGELPAFAKDGNSAVFPTPILLFHLALAGGAMFMTTAASLPIWRPLTPVLGHLQYPWRFLLLEAVGLMGLAAALPALLPQVRPALLIGLTALLAALSALPGLAVEPLPMSRADAVLPLRMWTEDAAAGQVGATWTGEFLPRSVSEQRWALGRPREGAVDGPPLDPRPTVTLTEVGYAALAAQVETAAPLPLRLHQFHLPGWNATVDGHRAATYPTGELGLVTVDVPAEAREVRLWFGATPARAAGLLISLASAAVWMALAFVAPRHRGLRATGVVLGGLALALALNSLGVGQRSWTPRPVQAALEDVAVLVAADAHPRADLGLAEVTLYWLALRETSQNYKAFVHLLGPDGAVIAQHDGDPVGGFTPTTRWRPGEIVVDRHYVPLPASLPPGDYGLRAGLYQFEPLRNLTTDPPTSDQRVDIGVLQLRRAAP
ncbi:MAG: hypothetical protein NZ528_13605 [Caldilineales bacterium]|nr:hypothetical protein [Caldilineales bacterium]MDW8316824.1 hypothetical protein [Anaerolineae bacterium]